MTKQKSDIEISGDNIKFSVPKSFIKKCFPYIGSALLSTGAFAGVLQLSGSTDTSVAYKGQLDLEKRIDSLEIRTLNIESVQRTMLIQLSDIKTQGSDNAKLSNQILLTLTSRR
jgi:hypothetical protein